ncbi:MAG TPA: hypothetical protein DCP28_28410 [Cytophagales bacterium]|nr:hypothetical protein [Cytophagales bacterium]
MVVQKAQQYFFYSFTIIRKNHTMRRLSFLAVAAVFFLASCSSPETTTYTWEDISVSGEFLFSGPNTLQGKPASMPLNDIASKLGIEADDISAVYVNAATIEFEMDTLRGTLESALVQFVANELDLISVATKSPLPATDPVSCDVAEDPEDILPYLQDATTSVVVDVNVAQDLEVLSAKVTFGLTVEY